MNQQALSSFIWSVADLLRGDYKQSEYGKVILPFTVLRRLDCVLEATKPAVLAENAKQLKAGLNPEPFLLRKAKQSFYNTSPLDMKKLMGDQDHIRENLYSYIQAFAPAVRDIFERFEFHIQIDRLARAGLLYQVTEKFTNIDLHPEAVSNAQMGLVFEELIRKFAEISNETAGEHFTPREVIRLMVNLLFIEDDEVLSKPGVVRTIYDPTAGTGGMLSIAGEYLEEHNPEARLTMFGQELNDESYAICKADMLIKGQDVANIIPGNTLSEDGHPHTKFDYMLSNPPFGVEWKKVEKEIRKEHEQPRLQRPLRPRPAARVRWLAAVPAAPHQQDAPGQGRRQPLRHRAQRLAAVHRRRRQRRKRNPPLRAGERPGRSHHRPAHRHVLQHRHQHLRLDTLQPQAGTPQRQGATHRRLSLLAEDAQEPGQQAQGTVATNTSPRSPACSASSSKRKKTASPSAASSTTKTSATAPSPSNVR